MTTPQSVKYTLGCMYVAINDLLAEDREVFNSIGLDELVHAKRCIMEATTSLGMVDKLWSGKK